MVVGAKVCELTEDLLWFDCGSYVGILTSSLKVQKLVPHSIWVNYLQQESSIIYHLVHLNVSHYHHSIS